MYRLGFDFNWGDGLLACWFEKLRFDKKRLTEKGVNSCSKKVLDSHATFSDTSNSLT